MIGTKSKSFNMKEISQLQQDIMTFVDVWAHKEKTPIPRKLIFDEIRKQGVADITILKALRVLLRKGYIRKTFAQSNKTNYVQLRRI
jgi:hypothetical protein